MEKLGVATQLLAPGEIFQSLQLGTIDSAEFANPSVDIKNGFYQVRKILLFSWLASTCLDISINDKFGYLEQHG